MSADVTNTRFEGDGRMKIKPQQLCTGLSPMAVHRAQARRYLDELQKTKVSHHSGAGSLVWIAGEWAAKKGRSLAITHYQVEGRSTGFTVVLMP